MLTPLSSPLQTGSMPFANLGINTANTAFRHHERREHGHIQPRKICFSRCRIRRCLVLVNTNRASTLFEQLGAENPACAERGKLYPCTMHQTARAR